METVAANGIFLVELVWQSIHVCLVWHGLMEGGVEYSYLWYGRQCLLDSFNTFEVGRVVQWSEFDAFYNHLFHLWGNEYRLVELLSAVYYAVAYCVDLLQGLQATNLFVNKTIEDKLDTNGVLGHRLFDLHLLAIRQFNL